MADGEQRLLAIRTLLSDQPPTPSPAGFASEEIPILFVGQKLTESHDDFVQKYQRLRANLMRFSDGGTNSFATIKHRS